MKAKMIVVVEVEISDKDICLIEDFTGLRNSTIEESISEFSGCLIDGETMGVVPGSVKINFSGIKLIP